jgi:Zn-finger nucleic acid-binding protein
MERFGADAGALQDCAKCGGQFVGHALLRELLEQREVYGSAIPRRTTPHNPLIQPIRYVKCPECGELMNRRNFGKSSGIIVDICHQHGVWFDAGEVPRVLAFVQAGGLSRAQRREQEELAHNGALRRNLRAGLEAPTTGFDSVRITGEPSLLADLGEATVALLAYLREKLPRR